MIDGFQAVLDKDKYIIMPDSNVSRSRVVGLIESGNTARPREGDPPRLKRFKTPASQP